MRRTPNRRPGLFLARLRFEEHLRVQHAEEELTLAVGELTLFEALRDGVGASASVDWTFRQQFVAHVRIAVVQKIHERGVETDLAPAVDDCGRDAPADRLPQ